MEDRTPTTEDVESSPLESPAPSPSNSRSDSSSSLQESSYEASPTKPIAINIDLGDMLWIFMEKLRWASNKPKEGIQATIFRVPENIRRTNVDSFEPKMVSLGPYHHGKQLFRATDEWIKFPCASNFFRRTIRMDVDLVKHIVVQLKDWESKLRCAYSEQISMSSDEFVEMMLLNCAFMAEFLREQYGSIKRTEKQEGGGGGGQRIEMEEYSWKWAAPSIINDMLVVANQFPLPPLLYLFEMCGRDDIYEIDMEKVAVEILDVDINSESLLRSRAAEERNGGAIMNPRRSRAVARKSRMHIAVSSRSDDIARDCRKNTTMSRLPPVAGDRITAEGNYRCWLVTRM
ncbi:hypothetical protein ZIOFF_064978 [Zingiber officinale]|uniref:Uncharacterized protein n=1 Tax=Zingiber officinale TaxID=94328 RepID=A0A8J5EWK8_ZINOF|nr:hypothetical protein ZIOFF_064978 [Zingiber officinale]